MLLLLGGVTRYIAGCVGIWQSLGEWSPWIQQLANQALWWYMLDAAEVLLDRCLCCCCRGTWCCPRCWPNDWCCHARTVRSTANSAWQNYHGHCPWKAQGLSSLSSQSLYLLAYKPSYLAKLLLAESLVAHLRGSCTNGINVKAVKQSSAAVSLSCSVDQFTIRYGTTDFSRSCIPDFCVSLIILHCIICDSSYDNSTNSLTG